MPKEFYIVVGQCNAIKIKDPPLLNAILNQKTTNFQIKRPQHGRIRPAETTAQEVLPRFVTKTQGFLLH